MMNSNIIEVYECYIAAYIEQPYDMLDRHETFMLELHNIGVDVSYNVAQHIAYEIAYYGTCSVVEFIKDEKED